MREAHPTERRVGIEYYRSDAAGTGGRLRAQPEEFRVRELETTTPAPLDADTGDYPHLLVRATLREWDTNDFARRISNTLGISRERVSWAGTKDKHAVTTQLFTLANVDAAALPEVADAEIEVLGRVGRSLYFGDLAGNAFEIRVRDADPETVGEITADLRVEGGDGDSTSPVDVAVPNYFGHQRFGSRRPVTHEVGLCLARGEWRAAGVAFVGHPADAEATSQAHKPGAALWLRKKT